MKVVKPFLDCTIPVDKSHAFASMRIPLSLDRLVDRRISENHCHDYVQIWYTLSGSYVHTQNGVSRVHKPGSVALIFPYTVHKIDSSETDIENTKVISISLYDDLFEKNKIPFIPISFDGAVFDEFFLPTYFELEGEDKLSADEIFKKLDSLFSAGSRNFNSYFSLLSDFFSVCAKSVNIRFSSGNLSALQSRSNAVRASADFLAENFSKKLSIKRLSDFAAMSPRSFTDNFKQVVGMTFHNYLRMYRLYSATELLCATDIPVSDIAAECGFSNSGHLINSCNVFYGMAPLAIRHAAKLWLDEYLPVLEPRRKMTASLMQMFSE